MLLTLVSRHNAGSYCMPRDSIARNRPAGGDNELAGWRSKTMETTDAMCAAGRSRGRKSPQASTRATRHEFGTSACCCRCLRVSHDLLGLSVAWFALSQLAYHVSCHEGGGGGGGEEAGVKRGSARRSSLKGRERTIRSVDEHWNRFKGNLGGTSERRALSNE